MEERSSKTKLIYDLKYYISTNVLGYWEELLAFLSFPFKKKIKPEKKFMIFSSGRSGSTLLISLLRSHPDIYCESEILKRKVFFPFNKVKIRTQLSDKKVYGFKFLGYQLKNTQISIKNKKAFMEKLHNSGFKIIYLERLNRLNQALSNMYAFSSNQWHVTNEASKKKYVMTVDMNELKRWLDELEENNRFEKEMLKDIPHFYVSYEDDLADVSRRDIVMNEVAEYIGVSPFKAFTNLKKIVPKTFDDFISNADEMRAFIKSTKYRHYLPDTSEAKRAKTKN